MANGFISWVRLELPEHVGDSFDASTTEVISFVDEADGEVTSPKNASISWARLQLPAHTGGSVTGDAVETVSFTDTADAAVIVHTVETAAFTDDASAQQISTVITAEALALLDEALSALRARVYLSKADLLLPLAPISASAEETFDATDSSEFLFERPAECDEPIIFVDEPTVQLVAAAAFEEDMSNAIDDTDGDVNAIPSETREELAAVDLASPELIAEGALAETAALEVLQEMYIVTSGSVAEDTASMRDVAYINAMWSGALEDEVLFIDEFAFGEYFGISAEEILSVADSINASVEGATSADLIATAVWNKVLEGSFTGGDLLRLIAAISAGKTTIVDLGGGRATVTFQNVSATGTMVQAGMVNSERTDMDITP